MPLLKPAPKPVGGIQEEYSKASKYFSLLFFSFREG
jgi:hypothetical protein